MLVGMLLVILCATLWIPAAFADSADPVEARGPALIQNAVAAGAPRSTAAVIEPYIESLR